MWYHKLLVFPQKLVFIYLFVIYIINIILYTYIYILHTYIFIHHMWYTHIECLYHYCLAIFLENS